MAHWGAVTPKINKQTISEGKLELDQQSQTATSYFQLQVFGAFSWRTWSFLGH
jgi:hypothetical protein